MQTATSTRPTPPAQAPAPARRDSTPEAGEPTRWRFFVLYPEDGITTVLLIAVMPYIAIASIVAFLNSSVPGLGILLQITSFGLLYGLIAVQQRIVPGWVMHIVAVILACGVAFQRTASAVLNTNYRSLLVHITIWVNLVRQNRPSNDNAIFLLFVAVLSFLLAYLSMWLVVRSRRPWLAVIANGVVLLINLNYAPPDDLVFLLLFLLGALLLLMRFTLADNLRQWRARRLRFSPDLSWDFTQLGAVFCVFVLLLAYFLPVGVPNQTVTDFFNNPNGPWQSVQRGFQTLFGGLSGPGGSGFGFFGQNLLLQGDVNLPNTEIMRYTGDDPQEYLITQTYDTYDGHAVWTQSLTQTQSYAENTYLPPPAPTVRLSTLHVTLTNVGTGGTNIFAGGDPAVFNVPVDVQVTVPGAIPTSWRAQHTLINGVTYDAQSYLSIATPDQLRAVPLPANASAGLYPSDVLNDYLTNGNTTISPEVAATAKQWVSAAGAETPYDMALAIEANLHTFTFSFHNGAVPDNQDAVVWFLHNKRGFCTFFASAMALMMRSLGMPARIAEGYNNGHFDAARSNYIIRGTDAHAWTQVYFPGYGWINFEPTASFPEFQRGFPGGTTPGITPSTTGSPGGRRPTETPNPTGATPTAGGPPPSPVVIALRDFGIALALLIGFVLLVTGGFLAWWRALYRGLSPGAGAYVRIVRLGIWSGSPPAPAQTPTEYGETLGRAAPEERGAIQRLTDLYVRERWGGVAASLEEVAALYRRARAALTRAIRRHLGAMLVRLLPALRPLQTVWDWLGNLLDRVMQPRSGA
jgi:transglutaminase-like putative cysteine protease